MFQTFSLSVSIRCTLLVILYLASHVLTFHTLLQQTSPYGAWIASKLPMFFQKTSHSQKKSGGRCFEPSFVQASPALPAFSIGIFKWSTDLHAASIRCSSEKWGFQVIEIWVAYVHQEKKLSCMFEKSENHGPSLSKGRMFAELGGKTPWHDAISWGLVAFSTTHLPKYTSDLDFSNITWS